MKKFENSLCNLSGDNLDSDKKTTSVSRSVLKSTGKSEERNEEALVENWVVIPPDGGWGWLVVVASFICNFVTDGCMYSFGMFLEEIGSDLNVSATQIAVANSIMSGFYFLLGPITCALMNRYGFRLIGIIGGLIACLSFIIASFVTTLPPFLVCLGIFGGMGFNMIFTPSFVAVGFYFERWRAMATSVAVCGSSIGMVVFPFAANKLLYQYTWRIKFQIIGALLFSCSGLSLIYRPLPSSRVIIEDKKNVQFIDDGDSIGSFHIESENDKKSLFRKFQTILFPSKQDYSPSIIESIEKKTSVDNSYFLGTTGASVSSVTTKSVLKSSGSDKLYTVIEEEDELEIRRRYNCYQLKLKLIVFWDKISCNLCNPYQNAASRPMYREDIFYTGSLYTVPEYSRTVLAGPSSRKSTIDYHVSVTKVATQRDLERTYFRCLPVSVISILTKMLDISLFKNLPFDLLLLSGMCSLLGTYTPFVFSELRAVENGMDAKKTFYILSTIGVSNTVGRIACGVISSFPRIDALTVTYISTIICGAITIVSNYMYTITAQLIYAVLFGFSIACLAALKSVILVEMLGLEKLTNAFGLQILFQGFASFVGVPISGVLRSCTGSYDMSFIFSGSCICISGILLIPIHKLRKKAAEAVEQEAEKQAVPVEQTMVNESMEAANVSYPVEIAT